MPRFAVLAATVVSLALPASSAAADRYTTTNAASGASCAIEAPCPIGTAIDGASPGDTVHVAPGTYVITRGMEITDGATVTGAPGDPAPLLEAAPELGDEILEIEGTARHLGFRALAGGQTAVKMTGGTGEDLTAVADGNAFKIVGDVDRLTLLRDSVAQSVTGSALRMKDGDLLEAVAGALAPGPGDVAVRNVTALSSKDAAVRCDLALGRGTLVNVIARGPKDVDANNGSGCSAAYSNLRPSQSNVRLGQGIQSGEPLFIAGGTLPLAASPTVDAGTADGLTSATDPDGRARTKPDIGAYECCAPAARPVAVDDVKPQPESPAPPVLLPEPVVATATLGKAVVVSPAVGKVRVRVPGGRFVELDAPTELPVGTEVDATKGRITLVTALAGGATQSGRFWGGRFRITQGGRGMTTLKLRGGDFSSCRRSGKLASSARKKRKPVRSLWSRDKGGRFRTHGHNSVATARGTKWLTRDTCAGTLTRVFKDAVAVRDLRAKRTVLVRAGHQYLARR